MKTINKGILSIEIDTITNSHRVVFQPVNGSVWMNKNELCTLFDAYKTVIDTCFDSIFKMSIFRVEDVCKSHLQVKGNKVSYDIQEVNLKVILAIAFQLDTPQAKILRDWFIERSMKDESVTPSDWEQNYSLN